MLQHGAPSHYADSQTGKCIHGSHPHSKDTEKSIYSPPLVESTPRLHEYPMHKPNALWLKTFYVLGPKFKNSEARLFTSATM